MFIRPELIFEEKVKIHVLTRAHAGPSLGPGRAQGGPGPEKKLFFLKCLKMISGGGKCVRNHSKASKTSPEVIFERIRMS